MDTSRESFFKYIKYEKRFSVHTLTAYTGDLDQFFLYLSDTYEINEVLSIDHTIIRSWIVQLMENGISARTVNRKITTLKTFFKFLLRQESISVDPMLKIQGPKTPKRLPVFVDKQSMDMLLDEIPFPEGKEGDLGRLIIDLLYSTGMRLSELINLKQTDVDIPASQLKVLGKRNKERIIPFNSSLGEQLLRYMNEKETMQNEFLLVDEKGKKLYPKFVYRLVNSYLSQVTTVNKKSPHILRHTFATHMLNNGADLNSIKELLGHASLAATQVYTHNTVEKLKSIHKQAHPKA
ncbi:MAG: tyrosine-type recombinase/integrase [Bacteroidota bacterium]|nr:tyrosine-type recombinase/integrase [Bacteroidota bacterium]